MTADTHDEYIQLVKIFREIDINHDGSISGDELGAFFRSKSRMVPFLRERLHKARPVHKHGNLFKALDADGSGAITEEEFCGALYVPHWNVMKIFRVIDEDASGEITKKELSNFFHKDNAYSSPQDRTELRSLLKKAQAVHKKQSLFDALDTDHSGTISKSEFLRSLLVEHWDLVELFRAIDVDQSGTIEAQELQTFLKGRNQPELKQILVRKLKDARLMKKGEHRSLFSCLDNHAVDGMITQEEFIDALFVPNAGLIDIFRHIDEDDDGVISKAELVAFLRSKNGYVGRLRKQLKLTRPQKRHQKLFKCLDKDKDGFITAAEFVNALVVRPPVTMVDPAVPTKAAPTPAPRPPAPPVVQEGTCDCIIA